MGADFAPMKQSLKPNSIPHSTLSLLFDLLPEKFRRDGAKIKPPLVLLFILHIVQTGCSSYRSTMTWIKQAFPSILGDAGIFPSSSAMSKARAKICSQKFMDMFLELVKEVQEPTQHGMLQYHDFRVLALDGTNIELPSDKRLLKYFGHMPNPHGTEIVPQAGLVSLFDVGLNATIDFTITACKPNERKELITLTRSMRPKDLVIANRGFPSREVFHAIRETGSDYLIRMSKNSFSAVKTFISSGLREDVVTISPMDAKGRKKIYSEPFKIRLIREESCDQNGDPRIFATSLIDKEKYKTEDLCYLYTRRWAVETQFRNMKSYYDAEWIHARTPNGVKQELIVVMIHQLIIAVLEMRSRELHESKPIKVDNIKRAATKSTEEIKEETQDVYEIPYTFNQPSCMVIVGFIIMALHNEDIEKAKLHFTTGCEHIWRMKEKRRPGRRSSRIPKSANAKQKSARRAKRNERKRKHRDP